MYDDHVEELLAGLRLQEEEPQSDINNDGGGSFRGRSSSSSSAGGGGGDNNNSSKKSKAVRGARARQAAAAASSTSVRKSLPVFLVPEVDPTLSMRNLMTSTKRDNAISLAYGRHMSALEREKRRLVNQKKEIASRRQRTEVRAFFACRW